MKKLNYLLIGLSFLSSQAVADNYVKTLSSGNMNADTFFFVNEVRTDDLYFPTNLVSDRGTLFTDYLSIHADMPDSWNCVEGAIQQKEYYSGKYFDAGFFIPLNFRKDGYTDSFYYNIQNQLSHNPVVSYVNLSCLTDESEITLVLFKTDGSEYRSVNENIYFYYYENIFVETEKNEIVVYNTSVPSRKGTGKGGLQNNLVEIKLIKNNPLDNGNYSYSSFNNENRSKNNQNRDKLKKVLLKQIDDMKRKNEITKLK